MFTPTAPAASTARTVSADEHAALGELGEGARADGEVEVGAAGELAPVRVPRQQEDPGGQGQRAVVHGASSSAWPTPRAAIGGRRLCWVSR
ncbi:hypothetical protein [Streptomyces sp. NPDC018059]|uniref:hypothetical protein n=1 Tax=Streptomyces sp. NPDC018059 TaxID=3365041 RepID=UPI0037BA472E